MVNGSGVSRRSRAAEPVPSESRRVLCALFLRFYVTAVRPGYVSYLRAVNRAIAVIAAFGTALLESKSLPRSQSLILKNFLVASF